jgi:hypothetical protein
MTADSCLSLPFLEKVGVKQKVKVFQINQETGNLFLRTMPSSSPQPRQ